MFNLHGIQVILTSLDYSKRNIAESRDHASSEQKQAKLREIEEVAAKVRSYRDELR